MSQNDDLAYGRYYESERGSGDGSRGLSDTFKKFKDTYKTHSKPTGQGYNQDGAPGSSQQTYQDQSQAPYGYSHGQQGQQGQEQYYSGQNPQYQGRPQKEDKIGGFLGKIQGTVTGLGSELATKLGTAIDPQAYAQYGATKPTTEHRFGSFAPPREHNEVKPYVDGCSYFWAVSVALENARESIWILDWWLSPELYLRRPPAENEKYRLDRLLKDAAVRGVRVNIIVYKEVTQALTLSSAHTKHALEDLHPNIAVFRHPDHLPDRQELVSDIAHSFQNLSLTSASLSKMSKDTLKGLYGMNDDVILYWAHHEKLCLVDGQIAFMGGLDLCFGRWDTHQHAISDVHPSNINDTVFPGQDYNNSRVLDFENVSEWEKNQLDRLTMSRMGWSDISIGLRGPVVEDLRRHFVERWNFIYDAKYQVRQNSRYTRLALFGQPTTSSGSLPGATPQPGQYQSGAPHQPQQQGQQQGQQQASAPQWQSLQSSATSHQQQGSAPQWQAQPSTGTPSYPPPPTILQPSAATISAAAAAAAQYLFIIPSHHQQQQHSPAPSYQAYHSDNTQSYQSGASHSATPNQPSPSQPLHQYSYTGDSFPPPPPGPAPSQSPAVQSYHPQQQQTQASYYSPPQNQASGGSTQQTQQQSQAPYYPPPPGQEASHSATRGFDDYQHGGDQSRGFAPKRFREDISQYGNQLRGQLAGQIHQYQDRLTTYGRPQSQSRGNMSCQIVRSCAKWSNGSPVEHSIADAYAAIIKNSQHFVYIENQFFITATGDSQHPVKNKIGAAIVERILRAARAGQKYKIIVVIPSVPCFAGDLRDDETLGTRAIMEFQYNSINRGGHSIMELIAKEGFNPMEYIRFYNLRNYDRINNAGLLSAVERESGVHYEDARRQYDQQTVGAAGYAPPLPGPGATRSAFDTSAPFQQYQQAAQHHSQGNKPAGSTQWDSVSSCYMLGGQDIRNVPWDGHPDAEIDAFVSEELYVHSKVMIADDRVVICGSANLNDRSQLGDHDSEIAVVIEDFTPLQSTMNGQPWMASRFAASLRRELFRKHLGLLAPQDYKRPNASFEPPGVPDHFDLECPESKVVADPLADTLQSLWNSRAHTNTEVFRKVFHAVPDDAVRNWATYKEFYEYYFHKADKEAEGKDQYGRPPRFQWGHVVRDDFAPGAEGAKQVKELLSQVKGTLVEMPLMFLIEEDIAKEGITLNELTQPLYT
ncbi:phospholipase D [Penicillium brasilianum]|uniref:phospholipase D n=1 Tax=Penicillium brasilianum TaxID=104259 RepID=A0A1S9RHY6_PENBI|nr:phospholipase D [Penicillium brasilianum]